MADLDFENKTKEELEAIAAKEEKEAQEAAAKAKKEADEAAAAKAALAKKVAAAAGTPVNTPPPADTDAARLERWRVWTRKQGRKYFTPVPDWFKF